MTLRRADDECAATKLSSPNCVLIGGAPSQPYRSIDFSERDLQPAGKPFV